MEYKERRAFFEKMFEEFETPKELSEWVERKSTHVELTFKDENGKIMNNPDLDWGSVALICGNAFADLKISNMETVLFDEDALENADPDDARKEFNDSLMELELGEKNMELVQKIRSGEMEESEIGFLVRDALLLRSAMENIAFTVAHKLGEKIGYRDDSRKIMEMLENEPNHGVFLERVEKLLDEHKEAIYEDPDYDIACYELVSNYILDPREVAEVVWEKNARTFNTSRQIKPI